MPTPLVMLTEPLVTLTEAAEPHPPRDTPKADDALHAVVDLAVLADLIELADDGIEVVWPTGLDLRTARLAVHPK